MLTIWRLYPALGMRQGVWMVLCGLVLVLGLRLPADLGFLRRYKYVWLTGGILLTAATLLLGVNPLGYWTQDVAEPAGAVFPALRAAQAAADCVPGGVYGGQPAAVIAGEPHRAAGLEGAAAAAAGAYPDHDRAGAGSAGDPARPGGGCHSPLSLRGHCICHLGHEAGGGFLPQPGWRWLPG